MKYEPEIGDFVLMILDHRKIVGVLEHNFLVLAKENSSLRGCIIDALTSDGVKTSYTFTPERLLENQYGLISLFVLREGKVFVDWKSDADVDVKIFCGNASFSDNFLAPVGNSQVCFE